MPPRVAIVEDHLLLAETLRAAIERSGIAVDLITMGPAEELLTRLLESRPDLVLLDLDLGEFGDSTSIIGRLTDAGCRVLVITGTTDRLRLAIALEQGALGYQPKTAGFTALVEKTRTALSAHGPLDAEERVLLQDELNRTRARRCRELAPFATLTERETETLRALVRGRSVSEIAAAWVVSENTVRTHVRGVLSKLGTQSQLAAVAVAVRSGWYTG